MSGVKNHRFIKRNKVYQLCVISGEILEIWDGVGEASKSVGIDRSAIIRCCTGKLKTAKGFKWQYVMD